VLESRVYCVLKSEELIDGEIRETLLNARRFEFGGIG